jgi:hypothetical protein
MNMPFDIYLSGRGLNILNQLEKAECIGTWTCNHDDARNSANRRNSKQRFEYLRMFEPSTGDFAREQSICKQIK